MILPIPQAECVFISSETPNLLGFKAAFVETSIGSCKSPNTHQQDSDSNGLRFSNIDSEDSQTEPVILCSREPGQCH